MEKLIETVMLFYTPLLLGFLFEKYVKVSESFSKDLSKLVLYVLLPALLFDSIYTKSIGGSFGELVVLTVFAVFTVLFFLLISRLLFKKSLELSMTLFYGNAGYLPIAIAYTLWGADAISLIGFYIIGNNILSNILIPVLSAGDIKRGLDRLKRFPPLYAVFLALVLALLKVEIPGLILKTVGSVGDLAPSLALLVLGLDIASYGSFDKDGLKVYLVRQVFSPILPLLAFSLGMRGLPLYVLVLEAPMSPAISNVILAQEYDIKPEKVSRVVLTSTTLTILTTIPVLTLLFNTILK